MRLLFIFLVVLAFVCPAFAQEETPEPEDRPFTISEAFVLDLSQPEEEEAPKKKKVKKRVYYGVKTRKGFTRKGQGDRTTFETFYFLKTPEKPNTFVRDVYYFDFDRREVRKVAPNKFDSKRGVLLHGPYKRFLLSGQVLEQGIYFKGTRHGRWMRYNKDTVLLDKEKYFKGWPKESQITYYDPLERKKVKEIIPIEYGEKEGFYYLFHDNGKPAVVGEFKYDQRVNDWIEYYLDGRRKKIIAYPKEPFHATQKAYILAEWNEKGKEIYRARRIK
ncbi:MAG: toxin-antitoxin system YwqK family antitoxin [Chryseotalea sp.]